MTNHEKFLQAIQEKKIVLIKKHTEEKGIIERRCVPYDYAVGKRFKDNIKRYWTWHIETKHPSPVKSEDIISIEILDEYFDPADYINWNPPYDWEIQRNWGIYS